MKLLTFIALLTFISCTKVPPNSDPKLGMDPDIKAVPLPGPKPEGQVVGTGGDSIRALFESGRNHAIRITERALLNPAIKLPLSIFETEWLSTNKDGILHDLRSSKYVWVNQLPTSNCPLHTCACTLPNSNSDILLSLEKCDPKSGLAQVGQLLLHESLHHFAYVGDDEQKADRIAFAVYSKWTQLLHSDQPHWIRVNPEGTPNISPFLARGTLATKETRMSAALWIDKKMFIWQPDGIFSPNSDLFSYNPIQNQWSLQHLDLGALGAENGIFCPFEKVGNIERQIGFKAVSAGGKLNVFCDKVPLNVPKSSFMVEPSSSKIVEINPEGGPRFDISIAQAIAFKDKILVLGGASELTGALFSPTENSWESISNDGAISGRNEFSLEIGDGKAFVWGGNERILRSLQQPGGPTVTKVVNTGSIYSFVEKKWSPMTTNNAPSARMGNFSAWTGTELLVFGGYDFDGPHDGSNGSPYDKIRCMFSGSLYNPATNSWREISMEGAPGIKIFAYNCDDSYTVVWIGTHLVVFTENEVSYYDPFRNTWTKKLQFEGLSSSKHHIPMWTGAEILLWNAAEQKALKFLP